MSTQAPIPPVPPTAQPTASDPTTAAAAVTAHSGKSGGGISSSTTVSSLADLKLKAPKVYQAMMEGIAMDICNDMQAAQQRLKDIMDEAQRNG